MRKILVALAALALMAVPALAQTTMVQLGTGPAFAAFVGGPDGTVTETNVGSFLEISVALDDGTYSGEVDADGNQIWYPNWYMGIGYTVQGSADPVQGVYVLPLRRLGDSNLFAGAGGQLEIWNADLFGTTQIAPGLKVMLEMPGVVEAVPMRLTGSVVWGDLGRRRVEVSLTGTQ